MNVQVYTTSWCRDCRAAKQFLDSHGIDYTEINVDATPPPRPRLIAAWASAPFRRWSSMANGSSLTSPAAACFIDELHQRLGIPRG